MTLKGFVGLRFDVTETEDIDTGNIVKDTTMEAAYAQLDLATGDQIIGFVGSVGVTSFELDLNNLQVYSGAGYLIQPDRITTPVDLTTIKAIMIINKGIAAEIITLTPAVANSFLPASEQITLVKGAGWGQVYTTAQTIGTDGKLTIVSDTASTQLEIYIHGA